MDRTERRQVVTYVKVWRPNHPLAKARGEVLEHRAVLYDKIGPGAHHCHFCGEIVTWRNRRGEQRGPTKGDLHTEHLDGDPLNNDPTNLVPTCSSCNIKHGFLRSRIRPDELMIVKPDGRRLRAISAPCPQCGAEFLAPPSSKQTYCSVTCADAAKEMDACRRGHPRTAENTYIYKGNRRCRKCMTLASATYHAKRRQ